MQKIRIKKKKITHNTKILVVQLNNPISTWWMQPGENSLSKNKVQENNKKKITQNPKLLIDPNFTIIQREIFWERLFPKKKIEHKRKD
jgi:hypothetical protein